MGLKFNPITGNLDLTGSGGSLSVGSPIGGTTPFSLLSVDASSQLDQLGPLTDGQILIGDTGGEAIPATLTGSSTIDVANAAGSITLSVPDNSITLDAGAGQKVTGILPVANGGTNSSSFTQGSVIFAGASGTSLTEDNSNLFWDNTNNRLGLNNTAPLSILHIRENNTGLNRGIMLDASNNSNTNTAPALLARRSRNTLASPTAVQSGDTLLNILSQGYGATTYGAQAAAIINFSATETYSETARGSSISFGTTANTTATRKNRLTIDDDGAIQLLGDTSGTLSLYPAAVTTSHSLILPSAQGAANTLLKNDGSGNLSWSPVSLTTDVSGILPVANGGTNSSTALNNNRLMISSSGSIVENAALTQGRVIFPDSNGLPSGSANILWDNTNSRLALGGIATPQQTLHLDTGTGNATLMQFTNGATSGQAATDGFVIGISAGAVAQLRQREALGMQFFTNNLQAFTIMSNGNVAVQNNTGTALATNATSGFFYISTSAGVPTGTPATVNGTLPIHIDSTNNKFYYYSGGAWHTAIDAVEKGAALGVATLDAGGKVPASQLPSAVMTYEGVWDASTNTPTLADGVGDAGMVYRVSVAGTQDLGSGSVSYNVGDYVIYNGTIWEKSDTTDAVASVNGQVGIVVLDTDDIAEAANLYFTDERAQDAVGSILTDTATVNFTYDDVGNTISADVTGVLLASADDINETSFLGANNQASPVNITGLAFDSSVRAFEALVSVSIDATTDLFEVIKVMGIYKGSDWEISQSSTGDTTNISLSITSGGQIQYTSDNYAGFTSLTFKFRATTLGV